MKKMIFSLLVVMLGGLFPDSAKQLSAQEEYIPFIDTTKRWVTDVWNATEEKVTYSHYLMFYEGTRWLDNREYQVVKWTCSKKVYRENGVFTEELWRCDTSDYAYIREDVNLRKVFIHSSLYQPIDSCNLMLKERLYQDPDALPGEELLMDYNLLDSDPWDTVFVSDRYRNSIIEASIDEMNFLNHPKNRRRVVIQTKFEQDVLEIYDQPNTVFHTSIFMDGVGYDTHRLYPIRMCDSGTFEVWLVNKCFSIGDKKYSYPHQSYPNQNEPCQLAQVNSVQERTFDPSIQVQNPAQGGVIRFVEPITGQLIIQDPMGRIVVQKPVRQLKEEILSKTVPGLYLLTLETEKGTFFEKVVVK